ncbi:flagellar export chaperone FliS [Vibrio barjaei]|uniref:flagellar export chaperone FliS n=1 Tax=Vibrio barjaei TaxID=1676683 RepID=UPI0022838534|nr:flagellar export chaperone FliS [Vibrio barjaei]MCY9872298.1 flagellar export chaperone FliS [Vibrio barjaei]
MLFSQNNPQLNAYKAAQIESNTSVSNSFELILLLHSKLLEHIGTLELCLKNGDLAKKQVVVGKMVEILSALDASLELDSGNELVQNIHDLYIFCITKTTEISVKKDLNELDSLKRIVQDLKDGWEGMMEHL